MVLGIDSRPFLNLSPSAVEEDDDEDGHTVVATARGVFNSNGGVLSSIETGVSIIIPQGAIPEGTEQEIYFKVCRDNSILPPLDKEKGERGRLLGSITRITHEPLQCLGENERGPLLCRHTGHYHEGLSHDVGRAWVGTQACMWQASHHAT